MAPLTTDELSTVQNAIDLLPEQDLPFRRQTTIYHRNVRVGERRIFSKLLARLAGREKEDQVAFLIDQTWVLQT